MPIYEYKCQDGHVTETMFSMSRKPSEVACTTCKAPAFSIMSVTGMSMGAKPQYIKQAHERGANGVIIRCPDIVCRACEHTWYDALSEEERTPPCPKCSSTDVFERLGVPGADFSNKAYPYYDRGLGCVVNSPGHRNSICKARGITPVDGDWDDEGAINKLENRDAELRAVYQDYEDRLENDPAYRGYRIARDQGRI